jgi:hypothetical protein
LKLAAGAELCAVAPRTASGEPAASDGWRREVAAYLARLARAEGGYGEEGHPRPHLTPTYFVIGAYRGLGMEPPDRERLAEFVRTHHPARLKKLEQEHREFDAQQIQALLWLGADASSFREQVLGWDAPQTYLKQYEPHGYPVFRHQVTAFTCREMLGLPTDDLAPAWVTYLDARRRADGSFNNTPAADGGDGHVLNTWWGIQALWSLGRAGEKRGEAVAWLRSCQLPGGGFACGPRPEFGGLDDVAYTWAAVRSLALLGAAPADRGACAGYLRALANADGGYGDRPGWASSPRATYYALDALAALDALDRPPPARPPGPTVVLTIPADMNVYSIQIEAHGRGSPAEAVDLAGALRIHLWGAKNAEPGWIAAAQGMADRRGVPVRFFVANEEYGTFVDVLGLGTYSHMSDLVAPAEADVGPSLAKSGSVSWPEFRARRLGPLQAAGGRLVWQFGENEELVRILLDDSLQRGGFAAISTFHFGNPDFTNSEPFLYRYRGRLPFVALQDAHGAEPWWFADMTEGFRTLFLAREPTWGGWLSALETNRVLAARHDAVSGDETWMHGDPAVIDFVREHGRDWRWWDNPAIRRPLVSLVALRPGDAFEAGRPEEGIALRVRCARRNTAQGLPREPLAELVRLAVDGEAVRPSPVTRRRQSDGVPEDYYHRHLLADPAPGRHTAEAVVRVIATGEEVRRTVSFDA